MTQWPKDAKEFTVSVIKNEKRLTNYSYIPKPILEMLGNPDKLKFVISGDDIMVRIMVAWCAGQTSESGEDPHFVSPTDDAGESRQGFLYHHVDDNHPGQADTHRIYLVFSMGGMGCRDLYPCGSGIIVGTNLWSSVG